MDIDNIPGNPKRRVRFDNSFETTMVSSALVPRGSFVDYFGFMLRDSKTFQSIMEVSIQDNYPAEVDMTDRQLGKAYFGLMRDHARTLTGSISVQHELIGIITTIGDHLNSVE